MRYPDAEIARLHDNARGNTIHRARDDSGQNNAERTNAAIGSEVDNIGLLLLNYADIYCVTLTLFYSMQYLLECGFQL